MAVTLPGRHFVHLSPVAKTGTLYYPDWMLPQSGGSIREVPFEIQPQWLAAQQRCGYAAVNIAKGVDTVSPKFRKTGRTKQQRWRGSPGLPTSEAKTTQT